MDLMYAAGSHRASGEERDLLEGRMIEAKRHFKRAAAELNTTSVAAALPEEVLVEIFKNLIAQRPRNRTDSLAGIALASTSNREVYGWIAVTHVCGRWRTAALRTAALWTRIRVHDLATAETFLKRSKSKLLEVEGEIPDVLDKELSRVWKCVCKQSRRIVSLKFDYLYDEESALNVSWVINAQLDLPSLKSLLLRFHQQTYDLPSLFAKLVSHPPTLETFATYQCYMPVVENLLRPQGLLQHLELHNLKHRDETNFSAWVDLLALLRSLPHLRSLRLVESLPMTPRYDPEPDPENLEELLSCELEPVPLPHLLLLQVTYKQEAMCPATLIYNITVPSSAIIRLTTTIVRSDRRSLQVLGSLLAQRLAQPTNNTASAPLQLEKLVIRSRYDSYKSSIHYVIVEGWTSRPPTDYKADASQHLPAGPSPVPLFELCLYGATEAEVMDMLVVRLPLHTVRKLSLYGNTQPSHYMALHGGPGFEHSLGEPPLEVFVAMTNVRDVVCQGPWLLRLPQSLTPREEGVAPLAALETLHMDGSRYAQWTRRLTDALEARKEVGKGDRLRRISGIGLCESAEKVAETLRAYADEVDWDMYPEEYPEFEPEPDDSEFAYDSE